MSVEEDMCSVPERESSSEVKPFPSDAVHGGLCWLTFHSLAHSHTATGIADFGMRHSH